MAILNYTTTVDAYKSVSEIEYILMKHGACRLPAKTATCAIFGGHSVT